MNDVRSRQSILFLVYGSVFNRSVSMSDGASHSVAEPSRSPAGSSRWLFTAERLSDSPSVRDGMAVAKELHCRQQAASHIQEMSQKLSLTQLCMNTAIVYMHRFYVFHSFCRFPKFDLAAAALFLAAKVEECPRKLEYLVKVSHALQHRGEPTLDTRSDKYMQEVQKIVTYENILLQTLSFDLQVEHPHPYVVRCCQMIKAPRDLAQTAYFFATDSIHSSTFNLRYRPAVVACICIHLACSWAKWEIPQSHEGKPWFYYVDKRLTTETLEALADEFATICEKTPERWRLRRLGLRREDGSSESVESQQLMSSTEGNDGSNLANPGTKQMSPTSSGQAVVCSNERKSNDLPDERLPRWRPPSDNKESARPVKGEGVKSESLLASTATAVTTITNTGSSTSAIAAGLIDETQASSVVTKRQSNSPTVIDIKTYKERRERELASLGKSSAELLDQQQQSVNQRKGFMPDLSNIKLSSTSTDGYFNGVRWSKSHQDDLTRKRTLADQIWPHGYSKHKVLKTTDERGKMINGLDSGNCRPLSGDLPLPPMKRLSRPNDDDGSKGPFKDHRSLLGNSSLRQYQPKNGLPYVGERPRNNSAAFTQSHTHSDHLMTTRTQQETEYKKALVNNADCKVIGRTESMMKKHGLEEDRMTGGAGGHVYGKIGGCVPRPPTTAFYPPPPPPPPSSPPPPPPPPPETQKVPLPPLPPQDVRKPPPPPLPPPPPPPEPSKQQWSQSTVTG
uniref:CYCLIN domain-containing protein n=1 Tax=Trichuris muris TaxID=70415 RepID=A0A5S6QNI9_TRIMR